MRQCYTCQWWTGLYRAQHCANPESPHNGQRMYGSQGCDEHEPRPTETRKPRGRKRGQTAMEL